MAALLDDGRRATKTRNCQLKHRRFAASLILSAVRRISVHFEDGVACKYRPFPSRHRTDILRTVLSHLRDPIMTGPILSFTAEDQLLLYSARVELDLETENRLRQLLSRSLDWDMILSRSWWHRIRPLVYHHLNAQPAGTVPQKFLDELEPYILELRERNERLARALKDVAEYFEQAGQRCLVFKGPALSEDAYGDLRYRECGDLDLLVRQDDFTQIGSMLAAKGFVPWRNSDEKVQQVFACEFEREDATLDVHWELAPPWLNYSVDFDYLWDAATPLLPAGSTFRKLCAEDALVVLSIHATKHWWERLRWLCDIAELLNRGLVQDWERVESTALRSNCWRSVLVGLWLARHLLAAKLPDEMASRVDAAPGVARLGDQVCKWLGRARHDPEQRRLWSRFRFRMGVCERRRDQLAQFARYVVGRRYGAR